MYKITLTLALGIVLCLFLKPVHAQESSWGWKRATDPNDVMNFLNGKAPYNQKIKEAEITAVDKGSYIDYIVFYQSDKTNVSTGVWGWKKATDPNDVMNFLNGKAPYNQKIKEAEITAVDKGTYTEYIVFYRSDKTPVLREDCLSFDPNRLEVREDNKRWLLTDGRSRMKLFDNRSEAIRALDVIKRYNMSKHCFVGRPNPSMEYWLVDNQAPSGFMPNEDCITFNPANLRIQQEGSQWLMTDGRSRMRMFPNRQEAEQALAIIQKYGFNRTCYIGRPGPSMTYFRK
jgi:hypothetical protein